MLEQGKLEEAVTHFSAAVRLRPDYSQTHNSLGVAFMRQGKFQRAVAEFQTALQIEPDYASTHNNLGAVFLHLEDAEKALFHFKRAIEIEPDFPEPHGNLGNLLAHRGRTRGAVHHYRRALSLWPDWAAIGLRLAWIYATQPEAEFRNGPEALKLALQGCHASGYEDVNALDTLAAAYAECSRFPEAVTTARQALSLARSSKQYDLAEAISGRLRLYENRKPFRLPS